MAALTRVLIANRGEIAVRIVQACRESGIVAIVAVVPGEEGAAADLADGSVDVPSYLDAAALVDAATRTDADAVHPGYGFLAEDAGFAERVLAADLRWIGPPPGAMRVLGDKVQARAVAQAAGVPVVPGVIGQDGEGPGGVGVAEEAAALGFPVLVKAAAGGGGRGIRRVDRRVDLPAALRAAHDEAVAGFGDGRVFVERRLAGVHHVEIQVLMDEHGTAVHLGERDCSLQRRHQKIVEESPSLVVDATLRAQLGEAAIAVARRAGYVGAGTAEFLVDRKGGWWFLEMNARLQVEHPVTEVVTGVDIVRAQLSIAAGEPLAFGATDLRGHAIEARVYAEDPARGFLPTGGRVALLDLPHRPGVRIDTALRVGDEVGLGYDPLLAKVIAWAEDRPRALARLRSALADVRIVGVTTNLGFLLDVLGQPDVVGGGADTDWVEERWQPEVPELPSGVRASTDPRDPWLAFGAITDTPEGVTVARGHAQYRGWAYQLADETLEAPTFAPPGGSLVAPMPATVVRIDASPGDHVTPGQVLAMLEAMKIQVQVVVPSEGTVASVLVRAGDVVARDQVLIELEQA
jgi:acetyl-CoA/propionyl-CoA carboxylase biotin carboxyl carrier protein